MPNTTVPAAANGLPSSPRRRSFLGGLVGLPLVGGTVALIGQPTASAEPVTPDLLEVYKTWLDMERRMLSWEMAADPVFANRYRTLEGSNDRHSRFKMIDGTFSFTGKAGLFQGEPPTPYARAALVLSTVGCDWREDGR